MRGGHRHRRRGRHADLHADDAQPKTISVTFRLHTDTDEWIAPTEVSDLPEGTSVFTVFQKVLADKGYTYEYHEQYCYVQAITAPDGTRLAEFSKGQNSGWLFRVNNDFAEVGMNDFVLMDGDEIEVLSGVHGGERIAIDPVAAAR